MFIAHGCAAVVGTAEAGDNGAICQRITLDAVGRHGGKRRSALGGFETLFFTRDCAIPPHVVDSAKGETAYCGASEAVYSLAFKRRKIHMVR